MSQRRSIAEISELISNVPNFPKPGIQFKDITPIMENSAAFKSLAQHMRECVFPGTTKLVAIESRGFILASAIAQYMDVGVVLARKPGKLPRATIEVRYQLEYGEDCLQMHKHSLSTNDQVTIIDDVLATGGTAKACEDLVQRAGAKVLGSCFMMELTQLKGSGRLSYPFKSLIKV